MLINQALFEKIYLLGFRNQFFDLSEIFNDQLQVNQHISANNKDSNASFQPAIEQASVMTLAASLPPSTKMIKMICIRVIFRSSSIVRKLKYQEC
ncbi:hypothetical protein Ccrd_015668 [Cynara cardunculus var. scolymus]|uniref:Uncharacterized protein n=1 Tax=Cynara cardunculus var. scolymus TaxID=59895 RepID=A0A103YBD2_CYNCS|nr:hypothetical protein Ccrd_015668 [Cynara cardunculus var. scolymus]